MSEFKKINLKKIREAIKQADANIKFEEIENKEETKNTPHTKTFKRGNNYDRRPLG